MIPRNKIRYSPYLNETYHGNYVRWTTPVGIRGGDPAEGILIVYEGNIFCLDEWRSCKVDKDGNPII